MFLSQPISPPVITPFYLWFHPPCLPPSLYLVSFPTLSLSPSAYSTFSTTPCSLWIIKRGRAGGRKEWGEGKIREGKIVGVEKSKKNKHKTLRCKKAYGSACLSEDSGPWRSKQRRTKKIKTWAGNRAKKSKQRKSTPRSTQIKKRTMIDIEKHIDVFRGSDRIFRRREREAALGRPGWRSVPVFEILLTAKAISWRWLCCQLLGWLAVKYGGWESAASSPRQPDGWSPRGEEQQQEKMGEVRTVGGRRAEERNIRKR